MSRTCTFTVFPDLISWQLAAWHFVYKLVERIDNDTLKEQLWTGDILSKSHANCPRTEQALALY